VDGTTQRRERGNGVVCGSSTSLGAQKAVREEKRGGRWCGRAVEQREKPELGLRPARGGRRMNGARRWSLLHDSRKRRR
jgi:hypothetical protein